MKKVIEYCITLLLVSSFFRAAAQDDRGYIVKAGDTAPDFEIQYEDGTIKNLSSFRGKIVMVQFTASWCGVCIKEMPYIESDIWQKYKNRDDFVLLGVAYKEDFDKIRSLVSKTKISYPVVPDKSGESFHKYAGKNAGVTRNVIIDRSGKIIFQTRLFDRKEFDAMKKVIDSELKK
ncbi:MAG: TlpA family protein disulfide reductase [Prevotellaceae bacterium]|jgi:peroxiredoxin|nr:TlpA family protein disulfide reductase [Prevotellaceae bacterium]